MEIALWILLGGVLGAVIALVAAVFMARQRRDQLEDAFKAIGADALRANSEQFLSLAKETFAVSQTEIGGNLQKSQAQLKGLIDPMKELIQKQQESAARQETSRAAAFAAMEQQIKGLLHGNATLAEKTNQLVTALRRPDTRGRWGETQLRNLVELAGMRERCDFEEQVSLNSEEGRLRPDMTVRLPGDGTIVVDSKVPLEGYLNALEATDEAQRNIALTQHANAVEKHVRALAEKAYWAQFERAPRIVVMFMPIESAYVAALEVKPDLHVSAIEKHVLLATPTNLMALLTTVSYGWRQEDVAANAREIEKAGATLYKRLATFVSHFAKVGTSLSQSTDNYNKAIGSLERNVLPTARTLKELNATSEAEIARPPSIEIEPRQIEREELSLPAGEDA